MKQLRPRRYPRTAALAAVLLIPTLAACGGGDGSSQASGSKTLRTIQGLSPSQFDPCGPPNGSESSYMTAIYAPLLRSDPVTGEMSPGIAEEWEYTDDLKTLTLKLQTGLKFSDGTPVDAEAVKKSLEQCLELGNQTIPGLDAISAEGDDTVVFSMTGPSGGLLEVLGSRFGLIASPTAREEKGESYGSEPVGAGPYQLDEFKPGSLVTLVKWDDYQEAGLPAAKVDKITSEIIIDPSAQVAALTGGQADFAWRIDYGAPAALEGTDVEAEHNVGVSMSTLGVDRSREALSDPRVRQAISFAIDRSALALSTTSDLSDVGAVQAYPPGHPMFFDDLNDTFDYNPDKAKQLLKEAGHADGLKLTGTTLDSPNFINNAVVISDQLAKVGIDVEFEPKAIADLSKSVYVDHEYDLISTGQNSGPDWLSIFRRFLSTSSTANPGNVPVPGGEEALAAANAAGDDESLNAALHKATEVIQEQLPIIPLYYSPTVTAWTPQVTGGADATGMNGEADLTALGLD